MKTTLLLFLILVANVVRTQTSYSGHLGKQPITLIMFHYSDGVSLAYYVYDKFDTPISINGNFKNGDLTLLEKDLDGNAFATLRFTDFKESSERIDGKWMRTDKSSTFPISLKKDFDIDYGEPVSWGPIELIQSQDTKNHYFKTVISKEKGEFTGSISAVKIYQKKTDKLVQTIELDCQLFGIDNVIVGDYNFDGLEDFSVFEASYAGPNTSRIYILRKPDSEKCQVSNFSGTSLEFDAEAKLIYEHNQCCAGRSHINATYQVIDNEMVLIERKCLEYDEEIEDYIETECD